MPKLRLPKQELFCHEYLIDFNGTQAAIRAKYSPNAAKVTACNLLTYPNVQARIAELMKAREEKTEITLDRIERELELIGFSKPEDYMDIGEDGVKHLKGFDEMPEGASRAIQSITEDKVIKEVKGSSKKADAEMILTSKLNYKFHDKVRALELLGRRRGLSPMKIEADVKVSGSLSIVDLRKSLEEVAKAGSNEQG